MQLRGVRGESIRLLVDKVAKDQGRNPMEMKSSYQVSIYVVWMPSRGMYIIQIQKRVAGVSQRLVSSQSTERKEREGESERERSLTVNFAESF